MQLLNGSAHRATVGADETQHAGGGSCFYSKYTAIFAIFQASGYRLLMRCAVLLADLAEALAGTATRWECGL